jgi:hypothetical protein
MITAVRGFLPWIAFGIIEGVADWRFGALAALVLAAILLVTALVRGSQPDQLVIELSGTLFFLVLTPLAFLYPNAPIAEHISPIASGWLAVTAWGSLLLRHPFTLGIARQSAPREVWERPQFRHINNVLTAVWSAAFTVQAFCLLLLGGNTAVHIVIQVAGYVLPMVFTVRYTAYWQRRGEQLAREAEQAARGRSVSTD